MLLYLFTINAIACILMLVDKIKAKKNLWRIPESVLFLAAIAGGSVGSLLGMHLFRHKTKHFSFMLGMPLILGIQIIIICILQ